MHQSKPGIVDLGTASQTTNPDITQRTLPCRSVPLALKTSVKVELDSFRDRGIMERMNKPTARVNQMAVVQKKNGTVRICTDPQPLNKALKWEHCKMQTHEDLLPTLKIGKIFRKLDVKEAFYHVRLDDKSADLITMITLFGRYRWRLLSLDNIHNITITIIFNYDSGKTRSFSMLLRPLNAKHSLRIM